MNSTWLSPTFRHQWIIENFGNLLTGQSLSTLHSETFPPECNEFQFSLRLLPNYVEPDNNASNQFNQSFISIFLHLDTCADNIILNTKYRIFFVGEKYSKEGTSTFTQGSCHGFTTFIPVTTLKQFLHLFGDKLNIICDVEIENCKQFSNFKILYPHSLSTFKVNHQNAIKLSCKWTLRDFSLFYYKYLENDKVSLRLKNYSVPGMKDSSFYLVLEMAQDERQQLPSNDDVNVCKKSISLFLYFESNSKRKAMVNYRLSILDWKGKPYITGEGRGVMHSNCKGRGSTKFISCDELLDLRNGLLPKNKLTIFAQIEILEFEFENKFANVMRNINSFVSFAHLNLNQIKISLFDTIFRTNKTENLILLQSDDPQAIVCEQQGNEKPLRYFKFVQKWTIKNYSHFFIDDHQSPTWIQSDPFPIEPTKDKTQFCLCLHPNWQDHNEQKYISIFVHLLAGPDVQVESIKGSLNRDNQLGFDEFVANDSSFLLKNGYLTGSLKIFCEIEILEYINVDKEKDESVKSDEINKSQNYWDASQYVISHEHQWIIPQYRLVHQINICLADNFAFKNLDSSKYCLYLWPKGESMNGDHLSLFVNHFDCPQQKVLLRLSILDYQSKLSHTKWICEQLIRSKGIGCDRFIENDYLFEQEHELLPENNLTITCEIEVLRKLKNKINDSIAEMENQTSSNHLVRDSIQSMNITNSIVLFDSKCTFGGNVTFIHK